MSEWYEEKRLAPGVVAVIDVDGGWFRSNSVLVDMGLYTLVVDTQYNAARARVLLDVADRHGLPGRFLVVNTHHHGDHAWGNHVIGGPSIMHEAAARMAELLAPVVPEAYKPLFPWLDFEGSRYERPWITIRAPTTLQGEGRAARLVPYTPAHTVGDIVVELPREKILVAGDLVFNKVTPLALDGTVKGWLQVLEELEKKYGDWTIVPGHGPIAGKATLRLLKAYMRHLLGSVQWLLDHGHPPDPLKLAEHASPGPLIRWREQERLVPNIWRVLADLQGKPPGEPPEDLQGLAQAMIRYREIFERQAREGFPQPPVNP